MLRWETLARARTPDAVELVLQKRGEELVVRAGGHVLMSSRQHGSEERLAEVGCARLGAGARVLVGGLGLGFTLRAALDKVARDSEVVVAELVPELVAWNRGVLAPLAGRPLEDARVRVEVGDVYALLAQSERAFDAILLDVDNGPSALTSEQNERIYARRGLAALHRALAPRGVAVVWSAGPDLAFEKRAREEQFEVRTETTPATGAKGVRHTLFVLSRR